MIDYFFDFQNYIIYIILFPIYLLLMFIFFAFGKRKINKNKVAFYGMFMGLSTRKTLALSFLCFYYYALLSTLFVNSFSYINVLLLFVPIVLFHLINYSFLVLFIDIIQTGILFLLLYSKTIFYNYITNVGNFWYVLTIYILLSLLIIVYSTYIFVKRLKMVIMMKNIKKEKVISEI